MSNALTSCIGWLLDISIEYDHTSTMKSTSTELLRARLLAPDDTLTCFPFSPKTSTIKSEAPLITLAWPVKDGSQLT